MAAISTIAHTRIDNTIIDEYLPQIGVYGFTVYAVILRHLNQKSGQCNPSYKTIARKIGIDRGTVIRYVQKLKAFNLLSAELQFKEDGVTLTSNQYAFQGTGMSVPSDGREISGSSASSTKQPPPVVENNHPSSPPPPKQDFSSNKKMRTIAEVDLLPTEKQKSCPHPPTELVFLPDDIIICHHCYALVSESDIVRTAEKPPEIVAA